MNDTKIQKLNGDTSITGVSFGVRVRFNGNSIDGLCGTVVGQRSNGRIVVKVRDGLLVEVDAYCLTFLG